MVESKWAILDDIDALVDAQLQQESSGYDHDINQPQPCRCGREYHSLPITVKMDEMRVRSVIDEGYSYREDTSATMCPGTNTQGPWQQLRPTRTYERVIADGPPLHPSEFDIQASGAARTLQRHREMLEMLADFGVPVDGRTYQTGPINREWNFTVGVAGAESRFMRDWRGTRRRVVDNPPREHAGRAQDVLTLLVQDPGTVLGSGAWDRPDMDDDEWTARFGDRVRENGFEPVDVAQTVSHRTLNRVTVQLSSRRHSRTRRMLGLWFEQLEELLASTRSVNLPLVHHAQLGSMTIVQAMDWCLQQLGRPPVKPKVLLVNPQLRIVEAHFATPQRRWVEAWSFEYAEWLGWDISEPRREIRKRVGRNVMGQTLEGRTIEPQAGYGMPLMELSSVQRSFLMEYRRSDRHSRYGASRAGIEVRRETFRNTEAGARARHPAGRARPEFQSSGEFAAERPIEVTRVPVTGIGVDPGTPGARPLYMRLTNGEVQEIGSITDEQAAQFNRGLTDPADVTPAELILGAVTMGGFVDEMVPPEPDSRTPQERALPRPSTTPPMWARNPTRTRRGAR